MLGKRSQQESVEEISNHDQELFLANIEANMNEIQILKLIKKITKKENHGLQSILKPYKQGHAILKFNSIEERQYFEQIVKNEKTKCKNRKIKLKPVNKKINNKQEMYVEQIESMMQHDIQKRFDEPLEEDIQYLGEQLIQDKICPLYNLKYDQQIKQKNENLQKIVETLQNKLQENYLQEKINYLPFTIAQIQEFYRNKEELTFGFDHMKNLNCGFTKVDFNKRVVLVDEPDNCIIQSKISLEISKVLQKIARDVNKQHQIMPYNKIKHDGFWRNLVIRDSQITKELILNLVVCDKNMDQELFQKIKNILKTQIQDHFKQNIYKLNCFTLTIFNDQSDCVPTNIQPEFIIGSEYKYNEIILNKKFSVSNSAFLQIHIQQCEVLYKMVQQELQIDKETIFLDICSGIGTIGICMAQEAQHIVAVEMIPQACIDAQINADLNGFISIYQGIKNITIYPQKIEDCVKEITSQYEGKRLVGVVDPPRAGLHNSVVSTLRTCRGLNHLVYIACNANAVQDNLLNFCLPQNNKSRKGPPFRIIKVFGVDLFPQTNHYETVFVLER